MKSYKISSFILSIIMLFNILPLNTFTVNAFEVDGYYTYTVSNGEATIIDVSSSTSDKISIPSTLGGYPVISIGDNAFRDCTNITSVTIPDSITNIGDNAFYACYSLESIKIGKSVTSIGDYTFRDCDSLATISIPDSLKSIGRSAFNSFSITAVEITNLAAWCNIDFKDYSSNPLYYGNNLYVNGTLATEISIPNSITSISNYAFRGCSLTTITIPNNIISIGEGAFEWCHSLIEVNYCGTEDEWNNINIGSYNEEITSANRNYHNFNDWQTITEPTCVTDGEKYRICPICNREETETIYSEGHNFGDWIIKNEATCTDDGEKYRICSICNEKETEIIPAHGHFSQFWNLIFDASCTKEGETVCVCDKCGVEIGRESIPAKGHSYNDNVTNPTCAKRGYTTHICQECGDTYIDNYTEPTQEHTYTDNGVCTVCDSYIESKHNYIENTNNEWLITKKNTASITITFSAETFVEENYDYIYLYDFNNIEIGKYTGNELASKSITVDGNTVKIKLTSDRINTAYGFKVTDIVFNCAHDYSIETKSATCTEDGYTKYTCKHCGDVYYSNNISAYGHNYTDVVKEAICIEGGYTTHTCENCGDTYTDNYTDATGIHLYENGNCKYCNSYLESEHDYSNEFDETWNIFRKGAKNITLTFSAETFVEEKYDFIYIYDANDKEIGKYTGNQLASKSVKVLGDTAKIRLFSDRINTAYGFKLTDISVEYNSGDLNGDGKTNVLDLVRLKKILATSAESEGASPDIDNDGSTNSLDLSLLKKFMLGIIADLKSINM